MSAPHPDAEGLAEPMRSRWSPTVFDPDHILTVEQVTTLLQAARWAPSWGNSQPGGLVVATRGSPAHVAFVPTLTRGNAGWVPRASLVLVAGTRVAVDPAAGEGAKPPNPDYARYDLGQAVAHVTLQAQAMGLAAHQFAGFDRDAAAAALGVPPHVRLMSGIAIGMRGGANADPRDVEREQRERQRRPLEELAFGERWGEPWSGLG